MTPDAFFKKLNTSSRPVIVDLWAPWCAPCRVMEPAFKQITEKYQDQVDVWKINADESPDVLRSLKVMGIPTTIGFSQGQEIIRKTGVQSLKSLDILFDATLHQRSTVILPPAPIDRLIRSILGILVFFSGWFLWHSLLVSAVGAIILFTAFYDRCPVFRAVAPRFIAFLKKQNRTVWKGEPSKKL